MIAVILAAGRGARLAPITDDIPKPMIKVNDMPILEHVLLNLPDQIEKVLIVLGHKKEIVKDYFGVSFKGREISYIDQDMRIKGTYGALLSAKDFLIEDHNSKYNASDKAEKRTNKFLVLGADDIFKKKELELMINHELAIGYNLKEPPSNLYLKFYIDDSGYVRDMKRVEDEDMVNTVPIATGAYVLDGDFWSFQPEGFGSFDSKEYGIPQTIRQYLKQYNFVGVEMPSHLQVNSHEDLAKARSKLENK